MTIATDPTSRTIAVRGSLDLATAPALCAEIENLAAAEGERIVVDLRRGTGASVAVSAGG